MGVKSKKKAKTRLDSFYKMAKEQGYRARSAFKLIQLNIKYDFLGKSRVLVDLCAAPGGWCQVAAKYMPVGSKIVGVDLVPIAPIRGCKTFVGDITDDKTRKIIVTWLKKEPVDTVIHDGAPNVGGVWSRDLYDQNALVLAAAKMACSMLKPGGWFVTKVFRSQDFDKLLWVMKQLFTKVESTKPKASRMESAETFVVCAGYLAPKHLDPQMFSPQKVFADVGPEKIVNAAGMLVTPKTNVPQGYDEFATVTHRVASFSDFLAAADPKAFLKSYEEIRFASDEDKAYLRSKSSKRELVYLCGDLQQVGPADAKRMLRWREQILREQARIAAEDDGVIEGSDADSMAGGAGSGDDDDGDLKIDLDSEEGTRKIAQQLLEIRKRQAKEMKKKQKKLVDRKLKQIKGLINYDPNSSADHLTEADGFTYDGGMDGLDDASDAPVDTDDFTVEKLALVDESDVARFMDENLEEVDARDVDPLNPVMSVNLAAQQDWDMGAEAEAAPANAPDGAPVSAQLVEGEEYDMDVDNYGNYIPGQRSSRVKLFEGGLEGDDGGEAEQDDDDALAEAEAARKSKRKQADEAAAAAGSGGKTRWELHHRNVDKVLNATFPVPKADAAARKRSAKRQRALEEERIAMHADTTLDTDAIEGRARPAKRSRFESGSDASDVSVSDEDDSDADSDFLAPRGGSDDELDDYEINHGRADSRRKRALVPHMHKLTTQELVRAQRKQVLQENKEKKRKRNPNAKEKETDFEEIPVALTDPDVRARTLAIAQKMLDPKARREILDASVNRYVFNDDDDLPDWFVKDEQRNCKVVLPVTAEEIEAQRARFRELNARPSKKVMEAMGRKRRKAQRMLHAIIERGKTDPRAREKAGGLSVRKLMRSQVVKGAPKKKQKYMDNVSFGQLRRDKQRNKRQLKKGRK